MITVNLTVFRETNGTLHMPNGSLLPTVITCEPDGTYTVRSRLETVILKLVLDVLVEQSAWSTGSFVATKIISVCNNAFSYVKEDINDVAALQSPCCATVSYSPAPPNLVEWEFFNAGSEPTVLGSINFTHSASHTPEADISISVAGMGANKWVVVRYSATENDYTKWYNTPLNNGDVPDSIFEAVVIISSKKYIKSRAAVTLDESQPLKFTH